ncbi:hypothetical protein [Lactococcus cremoris]|nr:hypothetical protein [Lactococcus cremoris]WGL39582.1 hypothetical protein LLJM3_03010 [Lactococcus cremoris]
MATGISTTKIAVSMLKAQLGQQERLEQLVKMVLLQKLVIMATGGLVILIPDTALKEQPEQLVLKVIQVQQERLGFKVVQEMMVRPELQEILVLRVRPDLKDLKVSEDLLDLPVLKVIRVRLVLRETLAQPIHLVMDNGQEMLQES